MLQVRQVRTARDRREFLEFPLRLYRACPYFVPPLYADEKKLLASGGCTENAQAVFYLAWRDGKVVGRIQGLIESQYNRVHGVCYARFTRFDCIDDVSVARALFAAVEQWATAHGMNRLCGPLGYNDLDREGLLVDGFAENSTFEEQYNYEYYPRLLETLGFRADADWVEYSLSMPRARNEMLRRVAERAMQLNKLHIASTEMPKKKYIEKYRDGFFDCLDVCYHDLYGTVALSRQTQDALIAQFLMIVNKKYLIFICDENERVVAFGLCFPAIGDALKKSGGRLTPCALRRVLRAVRKPEVIDLGLVAVRPEYQKCGVNAVILNALLDILEEGTVRRCETNLNLESNTAVRAQWKYFDARQHKRRRSYIKEIGGESCSND